MQIGEVLKSMAMAGGLVLTGCASNPPDSDAAAAIARAQLSIQQASQGVPAVTDGANLESAQRKLTDAQLAMQKHDAPRAIRLAQQSEVDAQLAAANSRAAAAKSSAQEVQAGVESLQRETTRPAPADSGSSVTNQ